MTVSSSWRADSDIGPVVDDTLRSGFDFTLLFEQEVLGIIPTSLFIVASTVRFFQLVRTESKIRLNARRAWKLVAALIFAAVQLGLLLIWSDDNNEDVWRTWATLPFAVLNVLASFQLLILTCLEDSRSFQPSSTLTLYLLFTLPLDIIQARTLWLQYPDSRIAQIFPANAVWKILMLWLESGHKRPYLKQAYQNLSLEATSGIVNRTFLWWLNDLFRQGLGLLTFDKLYHLDDQLSSATLDDKIQDAWARRRKPEHRFEFPRAALGALRGQFLSVLFPRLCLIIFTFAQPFLISSVLTLLSKPADHDSVRTGYTLIGVTGFIYLGKAISDLHYGHNLNRFLTMFRGASITLIYNHMLLLPVGEYDDSAVVTLMSTDVDNIVFCLSSLNECWARLIEVIVGIVLLARQIGWTSIVPIIVVIISFLGSAEISRTIGGRQKIWVDAVQKRITVTASALANMKSVKMMGLSTLVGSMIQEHRVQETIRMAGFRWSIVWQNVVQNIPWAVAPALTFVIYVAQAIARGDSSIDATKAFTSLSIITLLTDPASKLLSAIPSTAASLGCFDRIQEFLLTPQRIDKRIITDAKTQPYTDSDDESPPDVMRLRDPIAISADRLSIRPAPSAELVLKDVSFAIPRGSLTMVIGPVGSGKTTLVNAILGELPCENGGVVSVAFKDVGLCVQMPWLPNVEIRQAITGYADDDSDIDHLLYQKCLYACALDHDLSLLADGDRTKVGSASTVLSGGQRQRIALARAIYSHAQLIILDDTLSALDANTQATVMSRLFGDTGLLRRAKATVILVTHAVEYLAYADKILVVSDGTVRDGGTRDQVAGSGLVARLETHLRSGSSHGDRPKLSSVQDTSAEVSEANEVEDISRGTGDLAVYRYYFKAVGWWNFSIFLASVLIHVLGNSFSQIWLKWWTDIGGGQIALYMTIYLGLALLTSVGEGGYVWSMLILISPSTARKLHATLLRVSSAIFLLSHGYWLNLEQIQPRHDNRRDPVADWRPHRNHQYVDFIYDDVSFTASLTVADLFSSVAAAALVATGSVYMVISIPFLMITIWTLQHVYLRTSRQLRLLDLEAKSPLYSNFMETTSGLVTIRALGWEERFRGKNHELLDFAQRPHYLMYCIQRWLNLVLDLIVGAQAVLVVGLAVGLRHSTSPGLLGVSLNNILSFSASLSSLVTGWTMLETSLGSISRLMEFEKKVKPEDKEEEVKEPLKSWPESGSIEFRGVTASHVVGAVGIRDISLVIESGQRIGICGRTGSGKSSLVATILRLLEIDTGAILIDGFDLATVPRETIREQLLVIPQDPLVLTSSLRLNVDPHNVSNDRTIMTALERVGLSGLVDARGLDVELSTSSLSSGQKQLLALARVLVKKNATGNRILLLDEATSNVDASTDAVLQKVVRDDFAGFTTLVVAHRLDTIMDSDAVVVMDEGRIVEFGNPEDLLRRDDGWFARLARAKE
ncbi:ABC multidrug transporter B [Cladobotryum mycophilum]|uniref:ABC multidrug transporter B n=1 Tax=Cladobotryum mycophilum TaxID=491253 RepID=A0ABR0SIQ7_9HYPO